LVIDKNKQWLYIVDNGNDRIMRINIQTGSLGGNPTFGPHEPVHEYKMVTGYTYETVVDSGLNSACGIDILDDRLVVTDHATNQVIFYDISSIPAVELHRTTIPNANGIMGVKIGPDGKIYVVDNGNNRVVKLEPIQVGMQEEAASAFNIYPSLVSDYIIITSSDSNPYTVTVLNSLGEKIRHQTTDGRISASNWSSGVYFIQVQSGKNVVTKKIIKQ
jgi:hypothetical protein